MFSFSKSVISLVHICQWHASFANKQQTCDDEFRIFQPPQLPKTEPHLSALFCLPPFLKLDGHTFHDAHLQRNKRQLWVPVNCHFAFLPILERLSIDMLQKSCQLWREIGFIAGVMFSFDCSLCTLKWHTITTCECLLKQTLNLKQSIEYYSKFRI